MARKLEFDVQFIGALAVIGVLIVAGLYVSYSAKATSSLPLRVETILASCFTDGEVGGGEIRAVSNSIVITQPIQTSTPCYEATAIAEMRGREIGVKIGARPVGDVCIQCVGEIVARVAVTDLPAGVYKLNIEYPGGASEATITVL
jgi:hypothetical protein